MIYPGVVVQRDQPSTLVLGSGNVLFPGTFLLAERGGRVVIGDSCELGPGVVQVKANLADSDIRLGNGVRLLNGCELAGRSELGDGCQIIGTALAQSVRLGGGLGGYAWPEPDERGALLKAPAWPAALSCGVAKSRAASLLSLTRRLGGAAVVLSPRRRGAGLVTAGPGHRPGSLGHRDEGQQIAGHSVLERANPDEAIEVSTRHPTAKTSMFELRPFLD